MQMADEVPEGSGADGQKPSRSSKLLGITHEFIVFAYLNIRRIGICFFARQVSASTEGTALQPAPPAKRQGEVCLCCGPVFLKPSDSNGPRREDTRPKESRVNPGGGRLLAGALRAMGEKLGSSGFAAQVLAATVLLADLTRSGRSVKPQREGPKGHFRGEAVPP